MGRFGGKTALVTGASRGIGRAIAIALAREGAGVWVGYRTGEREAREVAAAAAAAGGAGNPIALDVTDRARVRAAMSEIAARTGRLDILVNNAGVNRPADFDRTSDADLELVLAVNLKGVFICCQEALPYLARPGGRIVNIGSLSATLGGPRSLHYAAAKAGVVAMTRGLARFCGPAGITVNTVAPGFIRSPMAAAGLAGLGDDLIGRAPLARLGEAEEVAAAVVFLASEGAGYVTGQTLGVNGGLAF